MQFFGYRSHDNHITSEALDQTYHRIFESWKKRGDWDGVKPSWMHLS